MKIGRYTYDWRELLRRYALRYGPKAVFYALAMVGLIVFYAFLQVHTSVAQGALNEPVWSCINPSDSERREELVDRAFARAIAAHAYPEGTTSIDWHIKHTLALVGGRIAFSEEERRALVLPGLEALPVCQRRG